jgi:hypothetical protein
MICIRLSQSGDILKTEGNVSWQARPQSLVGTIQEIWYPLVLKPTWLARLMVRD